MDGLAAIYAAHFVDVARWARACGADDADVEDLVQEIFVIVARKLHIFDGRNLRGFLYRITRRTVRDYRRSTWFRTSRRQLPIEEHLLAAAQPSDLQTPEKLHLRRMLESCLAHMSEKLRATFILFEIDGYTGEEIAQIQSLPVRTVWTRLHYARKSFVEISAKLMPEDFGERRGGAAGAFGAGDSSSVAEAGEADVPGIAAPTSA